MGFKIPEPYVWDESFKVFYDQLDEQHQSLFQEIFKLSEAKDDSKVLENFKSIICSHFRQEEELMSKANYADYDIHHMEHEEFLDTTKNFHAPVTQEQVQWIKDWLVNHIKGTDLHYKGKL